jgi:hypothetical protein
MGNSWRGREGDNIGVGGFMVEGRRAGSCAFKDTERCTRCKIKA